MIKSKLSLESNCDFLLIAISCHQKNHKVAWSIGKTLNSSFEKTEPHIAFVGKSKEESGEFDHYVSEREGGHGNFHLVANHSSSGLLIPEEKQVDFFLVITGLFQNINKEELTKKIKMLPIVLTAYSINPIQLKSKDKLIFE